MGSTIEAEHEIAQSKTPAKSVNALTISAGLASLGFADAGQYVHLRNLIAEWAVNGKPATEKVIGSKFRKAKNRPTAAGVLRSKLSRGINKWFVDTSKVRPKVVDVVDVVHHVSADREIPLDDDEPANIPTVETGGAAMENTSTTCTTYTTLPRGRAFAEPHPYVPPASTNGHPEPEREVTRI